MQMDVKMIHPYLQKKTQKNLHGTASNETIKIDGADDERDEDMQ